MNMTKFAELAETYGGDIALWPEAVRASALAFMESEPDAAKYLAEAGALDALLSQSAAPEPSELLKRRILNAAPKPAFDADWRRPAMAAALALFVGLASGFAGGLVTPAPQDDDLAALDYAEPFDGLMEDWSAWDWSDT